MSVSTVERNGTAKCPNCGKEITDLINWSSADQKFLFWIGKDGYADYDYVDTVAGDDNEFECPECSAVLFTSEASAEAFLKGEMNVKALARIWQRQNGEADK